MTSLLSVSSVIIDHVCKNVYSRNSMTDTITAGSSQSIMSSKYHCGFLSASTMGNPGDRSIWP